MNAGHASTPPTSNAPSSALVARTVVVLSGGRSSEREVSLASGAAVAAALRDVGDGLGPERVIDVEITDSGLWRFGGEHHAPEEALSRIQRDAVFFLALHGGAGEDGTIQGLLTAAGRVHTGSGVAASALCMCKSWTRAVLAQDGIACAPGRTIDAVEWAADPEGALAAAHAVSSRGWVVKPDRGGSSVATTVVLEPSALRASIELVLATKDRALVEARIVGVECTVAVLGNRGGPAHAFTPVEIRPKPGRFFDYEEKYSAGGASEFCPPQSIDAATCRALERIGARAHAAAECEGYSRTDVIVPAQGGEPIVLEINTLPGMTSRSLLPLAAAEAGISYRALCLRLLELGVERAAARTDAPAGARTHVAAAPTAVGAEGRA
jgi:D-alanine-D-alanine ligase